MQLRVDQNRPIYQQIIEEFKREVARGSLVPGDRIPSQRELAEMVQVNPNTVQRAYREMEQAGLVETLRGQGTFIRNQTDMVRTIRREMAGEALGSFVREMQALGFSRKETVEMINEAYQEAGGDPSGDRDV